MRLVLQRCSNGEASFSGIETRTPPESESRRRSKGGLWKSRLCRSWRADEFHQHFNDLATLRPTIDIVAEGNDCRRSIRLRVLKDLRYCLRKEVVAPMQIGNCIGKRHHLTSITGSQSPTPKPEPLLQAFVRPRARKARRAVRPHDGSVYVSAKIKRITS